MFVEIIVYNKDYLIFIIYNNFNEIRNSFLFIYFFIESQATIKFFSIHRFFFNSVIF